ncbi:tumor protein D53 isoform X1 [Brienomyrus brachyistius]|uniref:tumor protein D53 isoform X1 n=1 Tax=Brienomyrus brachyistius TaxID=42636 RepID=UPI0020B450F0|nr:tumor protein D53 isoform X1 [Brienomyrus brachyistius]XP_048842070.1 tumor protein D53 isoform X1 [Brienomyrus brachyistius]
MEYRQQGERGELRPVFLEPEPLKELDEDLVSDLELNNGITLEEREEREEMQVELAKLEEEIATLKQVLAAKEQHQAELKQKLGVTPLSGLRQNFSRSWNDMQASTAYKRTTETLSTAGQKTTEALSTLGTAISRKLEDVSSFGLQFLYGQRSQAIGYSIRESMSMPAMRNSTSFRSFEDKVESTVSTLKSKVGGNSSGGSFEEVLSSTAHASIQEVPTNTVMSENSERTS